MRRLSLVAMLYLVSAFCPTAALAQASCSFVLGFAEAASGLGPLAGSCLEDQRTLTSPWTVVFDNGATAELPTGGSVSV